jgi:hypothetical protein
MPEIIDLVDDDSSSEEEDNNAAVTSHHAAVTTHRRKQMARKTFAAKTTANTSQFPCNNPVPSSSEVKASHTTAASVPPATDPALLDSGKEGKRKRQKTKTYAEEFGLAGDSSDSASSYTEEKIPYRPRSYSSFMRDINGKEILRQWIDLNGKCRSLYGRVISVKSADKVVVEYSHTSLQSLRTSLSGWPVQNCEHMDISLAWGCVLAFNRKHNPLPESVPETKHVWQWLVPNYVDEVHEYPPKKTLQFDDFEIRLEARQSEIPGAGLGVFLQTIPLREGQTETLVLQPGVSFDLGVYSPLREEDLRTNTEGTVKSFLFDG